MLLDGELLATAEADDVEREGRHSQDRRGRVGRPSRVRGRRSHRGWRAGVRRSMLDAKTAIAAQEAAGPNLAATSSSRLRPLLGAGSHRQGDEERLHAAEQALPRSLEDARLMLERAMTEPHRQARPRDGREAVRAPRGHRRREGERDRAPQHGDLSNKRFLVLPFLQAMIDGGVRPDRITVLEQYGNFLDGTRVSAAANVPAGVKISSDPQQRRHDDARAAVIAGTGVATKFVRALTEATAAINFSLIKDHGICGYTGCLKNMTHGCQILPHYFHTHHARRRSPSSTARTSSRAGCGSTSPTASS